MGSLLPTVYKRMNKENTYSERNFENISERGRGRSEDSSNFPALILSPLLRFYCHLIVEYQESASVSLKSISLVFPWLNWFSYLHPENPS